MSPQVLRRQAEACARAASLMSDPGHRERILRTKKAFEELAGEEEEVRRGHLRPEQEGEAAFD